MTVGIIETGCANLASVRFALDRLGVDYIAGRIPSELGDCERLILPGVGAAGPAMANLKASGWDEVLRSDERPLLGICLGMQILFDRSEEGDVETLGLIPGSIERLEPGEGEVWPHMGWNVLDERLEGPLLQGVEPGAHMYFVHGFYAPVSKATVAKTHYGAEISAMVRQGHVVGCQFHPERSSQAGARILSNFAGGLS